jgi:hypothetical protein
MVVIRKGVYLETGEASPGARGSPAGRKKASSRACSTSRPKWLEALLMRLSTRREPSNRGEPVNRGAQAGGARRK